MVENISDLLLVISQKDDHRGSTSVYSLCSHRGRGVFFFFLFFFSLFC